MIGEMIKFRKLLDENGIEWHDASDLADELPDELFRIERTHFEYNRFHYSVIHGYGSYGGYSIWDGRDEGLLELMSNAINEGSPVGWLTADEAMQIILARDTV